VHLFGFIIRIYHDAARSSELSRCTVLWMSKFVSLSVRWKIKPLTNIIFRFCVYMNVLNLVVCNDGCCIPIRRPDFTGQDRTWKRGSENNCNFYFPDYISTYKSSINNYVWSPQCCLTPLHLRNCIAW